MKKRRNYIIAIIVIMVVLCAGCAKISAPTGGPKDTTPPQVLKVSPEDQSLQFNAKQIKLYFNEYITLNNPNDNVLVSPPLSKNPDYSTKGKVLIIKFKEALRPNTTYNMVFSDCIKDYHEGNALGYYHYSFSTGDSLDDYMLRGNVLDAKTLAPAKDLFVMLYKNLEDSLPLTAIPDYVTKSQSDGSFLFRNITPGDYRIFALKDINANLRYDLPNEDIAFLEETVTSYKALPDSAPDSLLVELPLLTLYSFVTADTAQQLARYLNPAAGIYRFPYKKAVTEFSATPASKSPDYFQRINATRDTITWFMKEPVTDSLVFYFNADGHLDTVRLNPFKERQSSGRNKNRPDQKLSVSFQNAGEYHQPLTLRFPFPVTPRDTFSVYVFSQQQDSKDTTVYRFVVPDTFLTELPLPMTYLEKKTYSVMIPDSLIFGYNRLTHDTLRTQFTTKSIKDYGTLIMNYQLPNDGKSYVASLLEGDKLIQETTLTGSETITYKFLDPKTYRISVFCDENRNGQWDPGDYHTKRQPEKVYAFPKNISIRAYWDSEETFKIDNSN